MTEMFNYVNPRNGQYSLIADDVYKVIQDNAEFFRLIIYNRDFNYDYFGFKTLERSYLQR
jgi:ribonucleoside-diphosphate reductase alpha chain